MYKDQADQFAEDIREMMKHFNLPYLEITIHNEGDDDVRSPLKQISAKTEALINALLGDVMFAGMEEGSFLLNHFENQVEDLLSFSSYLRLKHEKQKLQGVVKDQLKQYMNNKKSEEIPIPKVFAKALEEIMEKHKKPFKPKRDSKE